MLSKLITAFLDRGGLALSAVYDFTWRGVSAFDDYGVVTMSLGNTAIAMRRDTATQVAGRSGMVHVMDGAAEEIDRAVRVYLPYEQTNTVRPLVDIMKWLRGYGRLTLSCIPDRYMMARAIDRVEFAPVLEGFRDLQGTVMFRCDPYLYHADVPDIVLTSGGTITNAGTGAARPLLVVDATGDIDLMIAGQTVLLTGLTEPIYLDCELQEAYTLPNGLLTNANNLMGGDFPVLPCGSVPISWSLGEGAQMHSLTISPRWRDEC